MDSGDARNTLWGEAGVRRLPAFLARDAGQMLIMIR